jgi:hypothetical protein
MSTVITQCPVCQDQLLVARLYCPSCATALEGRFELGRIAQLSSEQLGFVETFIRCQGKLNRVQEELGISYPTVRGRLEDVIRALGYEVDEAEPEPLVISEEARRGILGDLAAGRISSEEAMQMLQGQRLDQEPPAEGED